MNSEPKPSSGSQVGLSDIWNNLGYAGKRQLWCKRCSVALLCWVGWWLFCSIWDPLVSHRQSCWSQSELGRRSQPRGVLQERETRWSRSSQAPASLLVHVSTVTGGCVQGCPSDLQNALPAGIFLILYSEPAEENFVLMEDVMIKTPTMVC